MKKIILICLLIGLIMLTGCNNPIASSIDKEGDKTRAEMAIELQSAKIEITAEMQTQMDNLLVNVNGQIISLLDYLQRGGLLK